MKAQNIDLVQHCLDQEIPTIEQNFLCMEGFTRYRGLSLKDITTCSLMDPKALVLWSLEQSEALPFWKNKLLMEANQYNEKVDFHRRVFACLKSLVLYSRHFRTKFYQDLEVLKWLTNDVEKLATVAPIDKAFVNHFIGRGEYLLSFFSKYKRRCMLTLKFWMSKRNFTAAEDNETVRDMESIMFDFDKDMTWLLEHFLEDKWSNWILNAYQQRLLIKKDLEDPSINILERKLTFFVTQNYFFFLFAKHVNNFLNCNFLEPPENTFD